jgi:hypothetical protein
MTTTGKVTSIINKDKVALSYTAGGKAQKKYVNKINHGFKVGQSVKVTVKPPSFAFVSVSA